jgi:uncharacterized protein YegL
MSQFRSSNLYSLVIVILISALFVSCSSGPDEGEEIDIELIEGSTELPAKVKLFFRVDIEQEDALTTLQPGDFEIYEDGALISNLEAQAQIQREQGDFLFSTVLLLDLSGSIINNGDLPQVKQAAANFIDRALPDETEAAYGSKEMALYWFDGEAEIHQLVFFTSDKDSLTSAVQEINEGISSDNSTNLNGAVVQGVGLVESRLEETRRDLDLSTAGSVVIFTDGTDQAARVSTDEALNVVQESGGDNSIFTIGLGGEIDQDILNSLGDDGFFFAENSSELNDSFQRAADILEAQTNSFYVLEYCSPKRSGQHSLQLKAIYEEKFGSFTTSFDASGFTGGCVAD